MRILHIINGLTLGGAETLLYRLVTRDRANEHAVVSLRQPAWYSDAFREAGIEVHHLGMSTPAQVPAGLLRLNRIVRESRADVVQCWMYRANLIGGVVAKAAGKPVIWGIHNASLKELRRSSRALAYIGGFLARWTSDFVINCSARSAELHKAAGFSAAAGGVIHNGYDASAFVPDEEARATARQALGLAPGDFAIGSISRWDRLKDIPNLLAALRLLEDRGVPFRCFLVGAGLSRSNEELTAAILGSNLADRVEPLGERTGVEDLARAFDVHLLASRTEAFPSVVAETMLSGTPNVVTDVGDAALMVGDSGFVAPPRDPQRLAAALADAYAEWRNDPAAWERRRKSARQRIADNFSVERMVEAYEEAWRKVAGSRAAGR